MGYVVEPISPEEKDLLYEKYQDRFRYTEKAEIHGGCIKILTEVERKRWGDNFYSMNESVRSHGRLYFGSI